MASGTPRILLVLVVLVLLDRVSSAPSSMISLRAAPSNATDGANSTSSTDESTVSLFVAQLRNPAEILTVLLIIGGGIVQKAVAQFTREPIFIITPGAFSFGWVAFSFNVTMAIFGDGILMPKPEDDIYVVDLESGTPKKNEAWVLFRLFWDLE